MNRVARQIVDVVAASLVLAVVCSTASAQDRTIPVSVPEARAVPTTATSRPFLGADHNEPPMNLAAVGYVEEEVLVSGTANVYDWSPDGALTTRSSGAPYTTRILIRRPADPSRFSGAVVVELFNAARRFDWGMMWGYLHAHIVDRGDAWVGITLPGALPGLQKFDAARYASLSFRNPSTMPCPGSTNAASPNEEGLRWDAISQIGALLKSRGPAAPLRTLNVQAVYLTSQGGDLTLYMDAFAPRARFENGKPVYDGFLARAPFGLSRINQCAMAPPATDPRQVVHNVGVPVIAVATQGEVPTTAAVRRDDSDEARDRYRLWEVAGAAHIDRQAYAGFPSTDDQAAAGNLQGNAEWPFNAPCTTAIPLMATPILGTVYDAALDALDRWARKGVAAPRAPRIALKAGATPPVVATDDLGHAMGGVRTPYVDAPIASYTVTTPGPGACPEMGAAHPLDAARLSSTYGSRQKYATRLDADIARLRKERWLTEDDAKRVRAELLAAWK